MPATRRGAPDPAAPASTTVRGPGPDSVATGMRAASWDADRARQRRDRLEREAVQEGVVDDGGGERAARARDC